MQPNAPMTAETGFDELADLFVKQGALCSPAELHGNLCGHLAAGGRYAREDWLSSAAELMEISQLDDAELVARLQVLHDQSLNQLGGGDFSFALLLPEDDTSIAQRTEALGLWCHGFLSSYAIAGGSMTENLSEDARETLRDLVHISQVAGADEMDEESDADSATEADFAEVYEYVRMAVMLVFAECNQMLEPAEDSLPEDYEKQLSGESSDGNTLH